MPITQGHPDHPYGIRLLKFAPTGNSLVYVDYNNTLFYRSSPAAIDFRLSNMGTANLKYNGIPDWVFEEEVFEDNFAVWWSPTGKYLAWGSFDDTEVEDVQLKEYGTWKSANMKSYPDLETIPYPKPGTTNPNSSLWLSKLDGSHKMYEISVYLFIKGLRL